MILMYHKVYPESPSMWWVDADSFYRQMCELKWKNVVYLDDYNPADPDQVVITFDGVYRNVLTFAAPILRDFGYPFELFVTSDYINGNNSFDVPEPPADFASLEDLTELVSCGGRLQWHTRTHGNMKDVVDENIITAELSIPADLRRIDNKGFRWFAYPHGEFNAILLEQTKKLFCGGVSCVQGNDTDRYTLNRVTVTNETTFKKGSITVIIPSYNYGAYLIEAIESVLRQTRPVDEIIIADDCSTDNTLDIGQDYALRYPGVIRFYRNEHNLGIVNNFNKAVSLATGNYICFLGADNRFRSDYIERTAEVLDSDDRLAIAYTDFALFGPRAKMIYFKFPEAWRGPVKEQYFYTMHFPHFDESSKQVLLNSGNFMHGSSLYKKAVFDAVGGYKNADDMPEDYNLFLRMIKSGFLAKRVPYPVLEYRQHSKEQSNIQLESFAELNYYKTQCKLVRSTSDQYSKEFVLRDQQLTEKDRQLAEKDQQLAEKDRQIVALKNSLSWKITAPLRWLHSFLGL